MNFTHIQMYTNEPQSMEKKKEDIENNTWRSSILNHKLHVYYFQYPHLFAPRRFVVKNESLLTRYSDHFLLNYYDLITSRPAASIIFAVMKSSNHKTENSVEAIHLGVQCHCGEAKSYELLQFHLLPTTDQLTSRHYDVRHYDA